MAEQRKCVECGKLFIPEDPMQIRCPECNSKHNFNKGGNWKKRIDNRREVKGMRGNYNRGRHNSERPRIPDECIFSTFYDEDGKLKKEIFLGCAKNVARVFEGDRIKITALRKFFNIVKQVEIKLNANPSLQINDVRDSILNLPRLVTYQYNRQVIGYSLVQFIEGHIDVVLKNRDEFKGFAQYFTSIICYSKQK